MVVTIHTGVALGTQILRLLFPHSPNVTLVVQDNVKKLFNTESVRRNIINVRSNLKKFLQRT